MKRRGSCEPADAGELARVGSFRAGRRGSCGENNGAEAAAAASSEVSQQNDMQRAGSFRRMGSFRRATVADPNAEMVRVGSFRRASVGNMRDDAEAALKRGTGSFRRRASVGRTRRGPDLFFHDASAMSDLKALAGDLA